MCVRASLNSEEVRVSDSHALALPTCVRRASRVEQAGPTELDVLKPTCRV